MDERREPLRRDTDPIIRLGNRILNEKDPATIRSLVDERNTYFVSQISFEPPAIVLPEQKPAFRTSDFQPIHPNLTGKIVPAYQRIAPLAVSLTSPGSRLALDKKTVTGADAGMDVFSPPVPADLAPTVDVQITEAISSLAASLGNSPARLFEWVKNNIRVEFYYGSLKGSVGTYMERAGNDMDTASLLMGLLRAAGIPCRYVTGTIEIMGSLPPSKRLTPAEAFSEHLDDYLKNNDSGKNWQD